MKPASRIPMNYISLDLETTGFSAQHDRITEIGAVKVRDGKIVDRFTQLVNPGRRVSARITELTGISNEMLEDQPVIDDILGDFIHWTENDRLVGHNIKFDLSFLIANAERVFSDSTRFAVRPIDTMHIDRLLFPSERHRLVDLIQRYGIGDVEEHRALSDATQTYQCLNGSGVTLAPARQISPCVRACDLCAQDFICNSPIAHAVGFCFIE